MKMNAVTLTEYGGPEVLQLTQVAKPAPKDNEILIAVRAVPLGVGDLWVRDFKSIRPSAFSMPAPLWLISRFVFGLRKPRINILGAALSGTVASIGKDVTRFKVGDDVMAYLGQSFGANAEFVCMKESKAVVHKPENLTFAEACLIPYGGMTAITLLDRADIQPGQKVLINGASGGIGSFALQLAKHYGAEVTGVCGTRRVEMVKALGADHVLDYTQTDFTKNGQQYDLIFDVLRKTPFEHCEQSLTANGIYFPVSFKGRQLWQMLTTRGKSKRVICALSAEDKQTLLRVQDLAASGVLNAVIDKTFPLEQTMEAHRYIESGHRTGDVVITV